MLLHACTFLQPTCAYIYQYQFNNATTSHRETFVPVLFSVPLPLSYGVYYKLGTFLFWMFLNRKGEKRREYHHVNFLFTDDMFFVLDFFISLMCVWLGMIVWLIVDYCLWHHDRQPDRWTGSNKLILHLIHSHTLFVWDINYNYFNYRDWTNFTLICFCYSG